MYANFRLARSAALNCTPHESLPTLHEPPLVPVPVLVLHDWTIPHWKTTRHSLLLCAPKPPDPIQAFYVFAKSNKGIEVVHRCRSGTTSAPSVCCSTSALLRLDVLCSVVESMPYLYCSYSAGSLLQRTRGPGIFAYVLHLSSPPIRNLGICHIFPKLYLTPLVGCYILSQ